MWNHLTPASNQACVSGVEGGSGKSIFLSITGFTNRFPTSVKSAPRLSQHPDTSRGTSEGVTSTEHHKEPCFNAPMQWIC